VITRITGKLVALNETEAVLEVGPFEYSVLVPDFVRRQLQPLVGKEVSLKTIEYLEGNPQKGRLTPRMIGFMSDAEREFFELICSVDGLGVKKALRAIVRPVREVARAIEEQRVDELSALPGIGPSMAERIVAKLRRKMAKFALMVTKHLPSQETTSPDVFAEGYEALVSLGHSPSEARQKIDEVASTGKRFKSVQDLLMEIYRRGG